MLRLTNKGLLGLVGTADQENALTLGGSNNGTIGANTVLTLSNVTLPKGSAIAVEFCCDAGDFISITLDGDPLTDSSGGNSLPGVLARLFVLIAGRDYTLADLTVTNSTPANLGLIYRILELN